MSKPSPANISYKVGGNKANIKFQTVISESHDLNETVAISYKVDGKETRIELHAVIYETTNRKIKIKGAGTKEMFKVLQNLTRSPEICRVESNLGTYDPVVFTNIKINSLEITLTGEEIQIAGEG